MYMSCLVICPILNDGATLIYFKCPTEFWQATIVVRAGNSNNFLHVACMMRLCYLAASLSLSVLAPVNGVGLRINLSNDWWVWGQIMSATNHETCIWHLYLADRRWCDRGSRSKMTCHLAAWATPTAYNVRYGH